MRRETFCTVGIVSILLCVVTGTARAETVGVSTNALPPAADSAPSVPPASQRKDEVKGEPLKEPGVESPAPPVDGNDAVNAPQPADGAPEAEKPAVDGTSPEAESPPNEGTAPADATTAAAAKPSAAVLPPEDMEMLNVETDPPGARVYIGYAEDAVDQEVGETPLALQMVATTYYLTLVKEGYDTASAKVVVEKGKSNLLRVRLNPGETRRLHGVRIAGNLTFWPGLVTTLTGIILIVVDNPHKDINTDKTGFALVGVGLTLSITGGLMLGLTYRDRGVYTMPDTSAALNPPVGRRGMLSLTKRF